MRSQLGSRDSSRSPGATGRSRMLLGTILPAALAGVAVLGVGLFALAVPWPRTAVAALVTASGVVLARRLPMTDPVTTVPPEPAPQSSGYHPAMLLATAFRQAAADPSAARRVRARLHDLAVDLLAVHGLGAEDAVATGLLSPASSAWLGLSASPTPGGAANQAEVIRSCVDELAALAPALDTGRRPREDGR